LDRARQHLLKARTPAAVVRHRQTGLCDGDDSVDARVNEETRFRTGVCRERRRSHMAELAQLPVGVRAKVVSVTRGKQMAVHPLAGKPAPKQLLVDVENLRKQYYARRPDITNFDERVKFGTSRPRGYSLRGVCNESHIRAVTQAICDYRKNQRINGPLYVGKDTHALSEPAFASALEVLAANQVEVMVDHDNGFTPTPVISHAI